MSRLHRTPRDRFRGSAAIEEVMALAVVLPPVVVATYLGLRLFRMFCDGVAVGVGWPFP